MLLRSTLYVPTDNPRAIAKAASLPADCFIFDLEDGVALEKKAEGRQALSVYFSENQPRPPLHILRINHRTTRWYREDIAAAAQLPLDGLMLSKVSGTPDIDNAVAYLAAADRADLPIWCNIETPLGITHARAIAAHPSITALVAGTNDLANDLRIQRTPDRTGLLHCLQEILLAARAHGKLALDGTFVDLEDEAGLKAEARQGRMLGFDGKTLIHPKQIAIANAAFGITPDDIVQARQIIEAYEKAMAEHKAVTLLNGSMIEKLHYDRALAMVKQGVD